MTEKFKCFVREVQRRVTSKDHQIAIVAQAMLETGRGESKLFLEHNNFAGMKWRGDLGVTGVKSISYDAHDGSDRYMSASTIEYGIEYYLKFIERDVYSGWGAALAVGPGAYIEHLAKCGWAGDPEYAEKVAGLFGEARELLGIESEEKKLLIIIGHDHAAQGAVSYNGISEYIYNLGVAQKVQQKLKNVFLKTKKGLDYTEVNQMISDLGIDYTLELHFNSAGSVAYGQEMLIRRTAPVETYLLADQFTDLMETEMGINQRHNRAVNGKIIDGVKILNYGDRGDICLRSVACNISMLYEPCFANYRTEESKKFFELGCDDIYAAALAETCCNVFGLSYKDSQEIPEPEPEPRNDDFIKHIFDQLVSIRERQILLIESIEELGSQIYEELKK